MHSYRTPVFACQTRDATSGHEHDQQMHAGRGGGALLGALDATGAAATEGRAEGKVDVLLGVHADHEGRHVDNLLADTARIRTIREN